MEPRRWPVLKSCIVPSAWELPSPAIPAATRLFAVFPGKRAAKTTCRLFAVTETGPKFVAPRTLTPISIRGSSTSTATNVSR